MAVKLDRWEGAEERSRDDAFAELYESSYPSLVKYCRGLLGENADPEEVAQEAFLRAWMTWDRYATSRPFCISPIRSPKMNASRMSWVTKTVVLPSRR